MELMYAIVEILENIKNTEKDNHSQHLVSIPTPISSQW